MGTSDYRAAVLLLLRRQTEAIEKMARDQEQILRLLGDIERRLSQR